MNLIDDIQLKFTELIATLFAVKPQDLTNMTCILNVDEAKKDFGDLNANAAMVVAKIVGQNPRLVAQKIVETFAHPYVEKIEIAGPGFLNLFLKPAGFHKLVEELFEKKDTFFMLSQHLPRHHYSVEFVSGNPTGPLHLGHGRNGIIGDVLSNVLSFVGHNVTKEYYINDAGAQIKKLGQSFKVRCQEVLGVAALMPEEGYQGEYLLDLARELIGRQNPEILTQPNLFLSKPDSFFEEYAKTHLLKEIEDTLIAYGITFDVWFSEKTLHESGAIEKALMLLKAKDFLYEADGALWFKSTLFGDDKDRVLRKQNGELTYVAADIAYMQNKIERGADKLVMVLGHDHHSYAIRLQGLLKALEQGSAELYVILYQLVRMKTSGQAVRMSKRAGNIVSLRDVIETVGADVARFFFLNRKADAQLEFDLDLALKKSEENPVYYVQYAYVRTNSILTKAQEMGVGQEITAHAVQNLGAEEALLIKKIVSLKYVLQGIAESFQTHILTYYVLELAHVFHSYYSKNRVIELENPAQTQARLLLITELRDTFGLCLRLLGVSRPQKM